MNARGTLIVSNLGFSYRLVGGARQGTVTVAVQFTDDRGNRINRVGNAPLT